MIKSIDNEYYYKKDRLFKIIDMDNDEHYINYNKLLSKSKMIHKMVTMDISEQKNISDIKLEVCSSIVKVLKTFVEKDKIKDMTIDFDVFFKITDYLSIDTEDLNIYLQIKKRFEKYELVNLKIYTDYILSYLMTESDFDELLPFESYRRDNIMHLLKIESVLLSDLNYSNGKRMMIYTCDDKECSIYIDNLALRNKILDHSKWYTGMKTTLTENRFSFASIYLEGYVTELNEIYTLEEFIKDCDVLYINTDLMKETLKLVIKLREYNYDILLKQVKPTIEQLVYISYFKDDGSRLSNDIIEKKSILPYYTEYSYIFLYTLYKNINKY